MLVIAALSAFSGGCGTVVSTAYLAPFEGGQGVFGGVRTDFDVIKQSDTDTLTAAFLLLDLPFSALGDTLTLPYTVACSRKRTKSPPVIAADQDLPLEGTWVRVSAPAGRRKVAPLRAQQYFADKLVVSAGRFTWITRSGAFSTATYTVNRTKQPWAIDFVTDVKSVDAVGDVIADRSERLLGICKVEGDFMTLCMNDEEATDRPKEFFSERGQPQRIVNVYRRGP